MAKPGDRVVVDGEKIKIDGNGLRTPTKKERLKGLPKSVKEAKKRGLNVYQIPGEPAKVMRYKARQKPDSLGLRAEHEGFEKRKDNREGKGGAGKGKRGEAEKLASPNPQVRSKAKQKMGRISSRGNVGHHGLPVSAYAAGKREAIAKGGPEAGDLFDKRYASVGIRGGAHSVSNIYDMSHPAHDKLHNVQEPKYFKSIKEAGKETDKVLGRNNRMKVSGLRKADAVANIAANAATGNYAGAAVGGGVLAMTTALQNPATQKAIGGQIARLCKGRATKSLAKCIPGLDVLISAQETLDYLKKGRLKQAGIAAVSGAIGWVPIIGDGAAASLDLTNTAIDISQLDTDKYKKTRKGAKGTTRRPKLRV